MKTSKPLRELTLNLVKHINDHYESYVKYNSNLIDISNGNLKKYIEDSMKQELNPRAYERSRQRIPPINILSKLQTKLSKVYAESPIRTCNSTAIDKDLFEHYKEGWDLDESLQYANDLLVINKYCALEPYQLEGEPRLRVLSAKDFIVYSDSRLNPNDMTVFIKFMGSTTKEVDSVKGLNKKEIKEVALFHAYSEDNFMIFDEDGDIHDYLDNPYEKIPFIYIRSNKNELIPTPDSDNLPMTVLIPKLMTDLNYAVMFGCRSQIVGIDVEIDNLEMSPETLWVVNSTAGEGKSPSIDTIKSDVDVDKVLNLINNELGLWLDTKGIKSSAVGKTTVENSASGISKLIDESDASAVNRKYKKIFENVETKVWKLLPTLHKVWIQNGESDQAKDFSSEFNISTKLIESKIIPNRKELLEELKLEKELGIFNKQDALKRLTPDATDEDINDFVSKVEVSNE